MNVKLSDSEWLLVLEVLLFSPKKDPGIDPVIRKIQRQL